jgi:hypothetical protein
MSVDHPPRVIQPNIHSTTTKDPLSEIANALVRNRLHNGSAFICHDPDLDDWLPASISNHKQETACCIHAMALPQVLDHQLTGRASDRDSERSNDEQRCKR